MLESFNQLALIGATAEGGVDRPTFSEAPLAMTLLLGSHLDSVPQCGCFDGALGVVTALKLATNL